MVYFIEFFKSLFDIGNSAGSLISEAVTLFKTFQKLSAPKVFSTKFSKECTDMFRWANKVIEYISNAIKTVPLSEYELFCIYTFIFPISIIIFISCSIVKFLFLVIFTLFAGFFALGLGISNCFVDDTVNIMPAIMGGMYSFVMIIIIIVLICCKCFFNDGSEKAKGSSALLAFMASITVFYILMVPIMLPRWKLAKIISIIVSIIAFICIMVYFSSVCCHFQHKLIKIQQKVNGFLITCLPLFIIPSTETFSDLIEGAYSGSYAIIFSYIYNSIIVPLALIIAMIILRHPNITEKYTIPNCCGASFYYFFELFDYMKQIGYAFAAINDVLWACLLIEIVWIVLVFAFRPYRNISEYSLSAGNSLIIIITNSAIIYSNDHNSKPFSFGISVFFLVLACIPAIVALYLYFIFDFSSDDDLSISSDFSFSDEHSPGIKLGMVVVFMAPISWFCYGLNFTYLDKTAKISYI